MESQALDSSQLLATFSQEEKRDMLNLFLKKEQEEKRLSFDPFKPGSRPTEQQQEILDDIHRIKQRNVLGGNQCLVRGTKVMTTEGVVAIEKIKVGDMVYDENYNPIRVKAVFANGQKEVIELVSFGVVMARCTRDHQFLTLLNGTVAVRAVKDFKTGVRVCQWRGYTKDSVDVEPGKRYTADTFDIHVESPTNLYLLANGVVTHNSGKTQLGAREVSWVFTESHPKWTRPGPHKCPACTSTDVFLFDGPSDSYQCRTCDEEWTSWGEEPLTLLMVAKQTKQYEEIWEKKIRPFLPEGQYKESKTGGILQRVDFLPGEGQTGHGNKILFFSHNSPEECREAVQSFVANHVWLDEMPKSLRLIEELEKRVQARRGYMLSTFTPKLVNNQIKTKIDKQLSTQKKYELWTAKNPIYGTARGQRELMEKHSAYSKEWQDTVLFGRWFSGENSVYDFSVDSDIHILPTNYHSRWRHVVIADPAASGKVGLLVIAEDPNTLSWYTVLAEYIDGKAPSDLIAEIEDKVSNINVVRRVSDPHEAWFIKENATKRIYYQGVFKKTERKTELIKNLQTAIKNRKLCVTQVCEKLSDELISCQWNEAGDKIKSSSRFHLLDCAQYGVDTLPRQDKTPTNLNWMQVLKAENELRKKKEVKQHNRGRLMRGNKSWR